MKCGFSFGKCVRDIVNGVVKLEDVLCIIARTNLRDTRGVDIVIDQYMYRQDYLYGLDEAECKRVGHALWNTGRIFEPRAMGGYAFQVADGAVWMDLFPTAPITNEMTQHAWDSYRMLINMTTQLPEFDVHTLHHGGPLSGIVESAEYVPPVITESELDF